jgi:hypothetical protein
MVGAQTLVAVEARLALAKVPPLGACEARTCLPVGRYASNTYLGTLRDHRCLTPERVKAAIET